MGKFQYVALLVFTLILLQACKKDGPVETITASNSGPVLPSSPFNYADIDLPDHFYDDLLIGSFQSSVVLIGNAPDDNPVTNEGATLGRVLFYDKNLSQNRTVSCASCHQQSHGFSDPLVFSEGFAGGVTGRHSMGLANAAYYGRGRFFWDERAATLEDQVLMPIQDVVEMGVSMDTLVARVSSLIYYESLFIDAFGDESINTDRISKALAQFVRSMVSYRSKYDLARSEVESPYDTFPMFTESENLGKNLFLGPIASGGVGCIGCHSTEGFVNIAVGPLSNGLDSPADAEDLGYFAVTNDPNHLNTFKTPSLKNIAVRPPYMHDGRFDSLDEVIEHYNSGVKAHPNLNFNLVQSNGDPVRLFLSDEEKQALKDFLETLTDEPMLSDVKFSDPFD